MSLILWLDELKMKARVRNCWNWINMKSEPLAVDNEITLQLKGSQIKHNFMNRLNIGRLY